MEEYLKNLLKENSIDINSNIQASEDGQSVNLTYKMVVDYILSLAPDKQDYIRQHMIVLDFEDGDLNGYFIQLAGIMVQSKDEK